MVFVTMVISLIFILINKCIFKDGKRRILQFQKSLDFKAEGNKYQERNFEADIPPLPPRTQFLTAEAQSYENLAEVPDYEEATDNVHDYEQNVDDVHDYEESMDVVHDYEQNMDDVHDYEQSLDGQSDYVKVEDEGVILPPPPYKNPDPATDNDSGEDYDDIGNEDEEDYDDVA